MFFAKSYLDYVALLRILSLLNRYIQTDGYVHENEYIGVHKFVMLTNIRKLI